MACPDSDAITRKEAHADLEILEHLEECPSCWFEWQMLHGPRHVLNPSGEVRHDLNQRVMARIARQAEQQERPATALEHCIAGVLVSAATGAFLLIRLGDTSVVPIIAVLGLTIANSVAATLFFWRQETKLRRAGRTLPL